LTNRSTTQRGNNGTEIADLRIDVENIIYNEVVHHLIHVVMRQDGIKALKKMEGDQHLITKAFQLTFNLLSKAELFKSIKDELLKDSRFKKDEKACRYFNNDVKVFVSWLNFRSTFACITTHVQNVLTNKQITIC